MSTTDTIGSTAIKAEGQKLAKELRTDPELPGISGGTKCAMAVAMLAAVVTTTTDTNASQPGTGAIRHLGRSRFDGS
jgi:hypothetical protein